MNCADCHDLLQRFLDGEVPGDRAALDQHLAGCPDCRGLYAAAARLAEGLRLQRVPVPPIDLSAWIAAGVVRDYHSRLRFRRRVFASLAAAAAVVLAVCLGSALSNKDPAARPTGSTVAERLPAPPTSPEPSLADRVAEAGSAVVSLTRRTADDTVEQTKVLFSVPMPATDLDESGALKQTLDPPAQSLREAGQGVAQGLEPVTNSARRAVNLFLRDLPPMDAGNRRGL